MTRTLPILAALLLAAPALTAAQDTATPVRPPAAEPIVSVLSVQGTGQSRVAPDEATVRLGVTAQSPTARAAQERVNRVANAILEAVRKLGVRPEQIQTTDLTLNPIYSNPRPGAEEQEPKISGYQASNIVSILLDKLDLVGPVVDAGLAAGANRLDGVSFDLRDDAAARSEALTHAAEQARAKAEVLARALRVRITGVVEVIEGGVSSYIPQPKLARGMAMMAAEDTAVSSGQVGVDASVTVRFQIEACPGSGPCS
jgi:hypothetical protein